MNTPGKFLLFLLAFLALIQPASAAVDDSHGEGIPLPKIVMPKEYMSTPYYDMLVRQAIDERPKNFDWGTLRNYYSRTDQYDPIGEATRNKIVTLAYTIENDPDPKKRKEAFDDYGALIAAHLANIDVISQAMILAQGDKLYGDPEFFKWVRNGLLRDIMGSGDGSNLNNAYNVITLGEEAMLLNVLRVKVLKTESAQSGIVYYNTHLVEDPRFPGKQYWLFVDVSKPLSFLDQQKAEGKNTFSINRQ